MPLYRRGGPFQRNSVERRSLRWRRPSSALSCKTVSKKTNNLPPTARTSLDLELDLQAQHARLSNLQDELSRLRELKQRLEQAREKGDTDFATWLLEDHKFQHLMAQAESGKNGKSAEDKRVEKMLKRTSKEIYKLRKTKAGKGKPDIISFKYVHQYAIHVIYIYILEYISLMSTLTTARNFRNTTINTDVSAIVLRNFFSNVH